MDWKSRFRNYGFWVSIAAFILMVLHSLGVGIPDNVFNGYVETILGILVFLGIINNPTTKTQGFGDDK